MKHFFFVLMVTTGMNVIAAEPKGVSVEVRAGTSLNHRSESFREVDAALNFDLPWRWNLGSDFQIQTRADLSAGWLRGEDEEGVVGTAGPVAVLSWKDFPLTLQGGSSPTLLSRHRFGGRDYGSAFQFTTHAGLNWDFSEHVRFGYRYQHMSNAGLGDPNPGLNLHMLAVSYRF